MPNAFGRDDMNALLGGSQANEELAAFRPPAGPQAANRKKKNLPNDQPDVSTMSAAETAAMLMEQTGAGNRGSALGYSASSSTARYRTHKKLAHHELAQELAEEQHLLQVREAAAASQRHNETGPVEDDPEESDKDEFVAQRHKGKREKAAPQIMSHRLKQEPQVVSASVAHQRRRRSYDDSASSDDSEDSRKRSRKPRRGRRGDASNSDSSSDDEDDRRRQRLLGVRKRQEPEVIQASSVKLPAPNNHISEVKADALATPASKKDESRKCVAPKDGTAKSTAVKRPPTKPQTSSHDKRSSGDSSSSGSDSSSDDDSNSSSEGEEQVISKPLFVPKHRRNLVPSDDKEWDEEEARHEKEKERTEKRKMESRALVAKTVAGVQSATVEDDTDEEAGGATNAPPNDDDDIDQEVERDAWEVRELERLLDAMDELKQREKERVEYERRRQMTDEEVLQHDKEAGKYQAPGSNRQGGATGKHMQRYYHRGAYYMAEDEWEKGDIRHKAADYARSATGEDKIDRAALPEVMQVKGFGMSHQNARYKGLAKEDTTDKNMNFLPLVHKKGPKR